MDLGVKPSFTPPRILSTRIATSETFGIHRLASNLADTYHIKMHARHIISGVPHHNNVPVHLLTKLSTKPANRYWYLQMRQGALYPITPVHTFAECVKFKRNMNDLQFRRNLRSTVPPHEAWKNINFEQFAIFWNSEVHKQDRAITDSNARIYYKLPSQLERYCKKVLAYKSERSTILLGSNAAALKPFHDLLTSDHSTMTLEPLPVPEELPTIQDECFDEKGMLCSESM